MNDYDTSAADFPTRYELRGVAFDRITNCIRAYGANDVVYIDGDSPSAHRARILGMIFLFHQLFEDYQATEDLQERLAEATLDRVASPGWVPDAVEARNRALGIAPDHLTA